ncbi:MAG TPA: class I SAM-dependent methyltransferase [Pyrinomonadaceae bacterium]|nr:class I SAM-dependent methyltransferase [Pyrinomonadaceae bacterium]
MSQADTFIYDEVPYPSFVFPQTHPDRLATMGRLMGIPTADPDECRVLELGCGDGTNLCSQAYSLPKSSFIGIDLSTVEIESANKTVAELGLFNIEFRQADVTGLNVEKLGTFDFIIAHGLFSWVPDAVRPALLDIYRTCLAPNGIGYISYNALPGCHIRRITSDLMQYHSRNETDAITKVGVGIAGLSEIASAASDDSVYQMMLFLEAEQIAERTLENVFHDDHSAYNQPFYFHEFCSMIADRGLSFVCEAEPSDMLDKDLSDKALEYLDSVTNDPLVRSQYRDFITGRRFRSSLICRSSNKPATSPKPSKIDRLFLSTQLTSSDSARYDDDSTVQFDSASGNNLKLNHPLTKFVLLELERCRPQTPSFSELLDTAELSLEDEFLGDEHIERLRGFLLQMFLAGFVKLHSFRLPVTSEISTRPTVSKFARWQLSRGSKTVTTFNGSNLEIEIPAVAKLISLLDGTREVSDLVKLIAAEYGSDQPISDVETMVKENLKSLLNARLLVD